MSLTGCKSIGASNDRAWSPDQAILPSAEIEQEQIMVRKIRNCTYLSEEDYIVEHYDRQFDLRRLQTVDFIVVPFKGMPALAHTMLSFGFQTDNPQKQEYLGVSVEIRKEWDEKYDPVKGMLNEYELMYVVGDERDLIQRRTNYQFDDVYVYRVKASPEKVQGVFVDIMQRVNKLKRKPEFYHTLTNNCTTNIVNHVNKLNPSLIPYNTQVLLPGLSDELAYGLGILETKGSFQETKQQAHVNERALRYAAEADFSNLIRR